MSVEACRIERVTIPRSSTSISTFSRSAILILVGAPPLLLDPERPVHVTPHDRDRLAQEDVRLKMIVLCEPVAFEDCFLSEQLDVARSYSSGIKKCARLHAAVFQSRGCIIRIVD